MDINGSSPSFPINKPTLLLFLTSPVGFMLHFAIILKHRYHLLITFIKFNKEEQFTIAFLSQQMMVYHTDSSLNADFWGTP